MTELRDAIAKNICKLRTDAGMTQAALAEVLNYSDKAVSKWERSESVPDVFMLKRIAEYFGVTIDYLLEIEHTPEQEVARVEKNKKSKRNKTIVALLAGCCCWLVATIAFVILVIAHQDAFPAWLCFIYAMPVCSIVNIVFNSMWGRAKLNYLIISVLIWTLILSIYLTVLLIWGPNIWELFLVGIPGQIITFIWSLFTKKQK